MTLTTLPRCPLPEGWAALPLGLVPDEHIVRRLREQGVPASRSTLSRARHLLGIPTCKPPKTPRPPRTRRPPVDWHLLPLGVIFDALIAKHLGLTHPAVLLQRRRRNIPVAPRSLENLLLGLVQRRPGLRHRSYAAHLDTPLPSLLKSARSLASLGLISLDDETLNPIVKPRSPHRRSSANSLPNP